MDNKIATLIRIEEDIFEEIKLIASEENRSFNKQIEYILKKFIEEQQEKKDKE